MLTFEEFAKKVEYLPLEQQKECYKWYLKGARELMKQVLCKAEHYCGSMMKENACDDCCPESFIKDFIDDMEKELKNAETEEN